MTTNQKINIESLLNYYNHRSDKEYDRMLRYEKEGDVEKAKHAKLRGDLVDVFIYGVVETLKLLGYAIKWEYGDGNHFVRIIDEA